MTSGKKAGLSAGGIMIHCLSSTNVEMEKNNSFLLAWSLFITPINKSLLSPLSTLFASAVTLFTLFFFPFWLLEDYRLTFLVPSVMQPLLGETQSRPWEVPYDKYSTREAWFPSLVFYTDVANYHFFVLFFFSFLFTIIVYLPYIWPGVGEKNQLWEEVDVRESERTCSEHWTCQWEKTLIPPLLKCSLSICLTFLSASFHVSPDSVLLQGRSWISPQRLHCCSERESSLDHLSGFLMPRRALP